MARSRTISRRQDEGTKQRSLGDQPTPFVGLALSPLIALVGSWVLHYLIAGVTVGDRVLLAGSPTFLAVTISFVTLAAVGLSVAAWHFSKGRTPPVRYFLVGSVFIVVEWIAVLIGVGPHRWWGTLFVLTAWSVVGLWVLPRLHVLRRDPREGNDDHDDKEDGLIEQLGLSGYKTRGEPEVRYAPDGEPERIIVDIRHRFGGTRKTLLDALPNVESAVGAPEGLSRVTKPADGKSNHSIMTVMLRDPLVFRVPYNGPSAAGDPITGYSVIGRYDDGDPVRVMPFGGTDNDGINLPPTGYAFMGMTRAGKTVGENRLLLDGVITRKGGVIVYLNKAKGGQDVQPIIAGVAVAVLSDSNADYRTAMKIIRDILTYRQKQLARYGISAWRYDKCIENPPQQTLDGKPIPMEPMPQIVVHVGEADAILETAGEEAVYLASKGLSVGIICGWSMQRFSATSMPTDLRMNIGTRFCYGVGDDYSAGFALSDETIKSGAHPENWRNTKPGRFFVEGAGIPDTQWPVSAKTIGDVDDDTLYDRMRRESEEYGPQMTPIDPGSVAATRGWWEKHERETTQLRTTLTPAVTSTDSRPDSGPTTRQEDPMGRPAPAPTRAFNTDPDPVADSFDADHADHLTDVAAEIAETTEVGGDRILGDLIEPDPLDPEFDEFNAIDERVPVPVPTQDDGINLAGDKPEPQSREEAELAFDEALRQLASDDGFVDPDDDRYVLFRTGQLQAFYRFRTRQWYSPLLGAMADGQRDCPPGLTVTRAADKGRDGWYRMTRIMPPEQPVS